MVVVALHKRAISSMALLIMVLVIIMIAGASAYFLVSNRQKTSTAVSCRVEYYSVWSIVQFTNSSTSFSTTTLSSSSNYTTTTNVRQPIGYALTTTIEYTGTLTGAIAQWHVEDCTYTAK